MYAKRYKRPTPAIGPDAMAVIRSHVWPGNVRELEHWVESAVVLAPDGRITAAHLPRSRLPVTPPAATAEAPAKGAAGEASAVKAVPLGLTLEEATRRYVAATVEALGGNKAEAARRLEVGRNTIGRILKGERESLTSEREPGADDD